MTCPMEGEGTREVLVAYGGGRALNGNDTQLLEAHLETCPRCREFVRGQRAVWDALDGWEAEPVSADFDRRLFARIEQEVPWWQRIRGRLGVLLIHRALPVTAVAALVVAGVLLDRPSLLKRRVPPETDQVEGLQPDQVVHALDEMEVLNQFNRSMKPDAAQPQM